MSKTVSGLVKKSGYADHPEHTLKTSLVQGQITVWRNKILLARSDKGLVLQEASYPPVYYFPREDAEMSLLTPTKTETWCPFKGNASYFAIDAGEDLTPDAVWSYEDPFLEISEIKDHLAFYPDQVRIEIAAGT